MQRLVLESLLKQNWEAGDLSRMPVSFFTNTLLPAALTPGTIKGKLISCLSGSDGSVKLISILPSKACQNFSARSGECELQHSDFAQFQVLQALSKSC